VIQEFATNKPKHSFREAIGLGNGRRLRGQ